MEALNKLAVWLLFAIPLTFARLAILGKIYNLTMLNLLGTPPITMWQMFALTWFVGALTLQISSDEEKKDSKKVVLRMISHTLTLLVSWGLAALIF